MQRLIGLGVFSVCFFLTGVLDAMAVVSDEEFEAMKKRLGMVEKELSDLKKHESEESGVKAKKEAESPLSFGSTGSGKLLCWRLLLRAGDRCRKGRRRR